jgi:tetratricopeptide (TPR) repeat protein
MSEGAKASFMIWSQMIAEADYFLCKQDYEEAANKYGAALKLDPNNNHVLICRSHCRVLLGDCVGAEEDADAILKNNPTNVKAYLCKANALFCGGKFEESLIWYWRGKNQKPEIAEFEIGIKKCEESINNVISKAKAERMKAHIEKEAATNNNCNIHKDRSLDNRSMESGLLDELYVDYLFLKKLERDPVFESRTDLKSAITGTLDYLGKQAEVWRARNTRDVYEATVLGQLQHCNDKIIAVVKNYELSVGK